MTTSLRPHRVEARGIFQSTPLLKNLPRSLSLHSVKGGDAVSFVELERRVAETAQALSGCLPERPSRVVVGVNAPIDCLVTLFATWVVGHCAVLVNPGLSEEEKSRVASNVSACVWCDDDGIQTLALEKTVDISASGEALILMTSGTTGVPKGVVHSLETLENRLKLNVKEIGTDLLARTLCPLPLFFGHGLIGNCLTPLYAGQTVHILEAPGLQDFARFGAILDEHDITFLSSVPSMWRMILRVSDRPVTAPRRVHVGSAPLTEELWCNIEAWCGTDRVFNTYGMTETANWISGGTRPAKNVDGFVGKPWGGDFSVLRDGNFKSTGRGEVALHSPTLMLGLWSADRLLTKAETPFLTGDIGELAEDQSLRLVGRSKNEINRAGIKVLAEEVDMLLERHPSVTEACAFGIPDDIAGELVGAVVTIRDGVLTTAPELIAWCRENARHDAVPSRLEVVDSIEKTDRGKLARQKIQKEKIQQWC